MERMALGSTPSGARQQPQQVHVRPGAEGTPSHKALARAAHIERADEGYFDSYGYFDIHRTMLADKARTILLHQTCMLPQFACILFFQIHGTHAELGHSV